MKRFWRRWRHQVTLWVCVALCPLILLLPLQSPPPGDSPAATQIAYPEIPRTPLPTLPPYILQGRGLPPGDDPVIKLSMPGGVDWPAEEWALVGGGCPSLKPEHAFSAWHDYPGWCFPYEPREWPSVWPPPHPVFPGLAGPGAKLLATGGGGTQEDRGREWPNWPIQPQTPDIPTAQLPILPAIPPEVSPPAYVEPPIVPDPASLGLAMIAAVCGLLTRQRTSVAHARP